MDEGLGDSGGRLRFPRQGEMDAVTSLPPRRALDEDLPRLLKLLAMERLPLSAIMIDIDHFKAFNDRWGHAIGDMVLFHVARLLRESVRYRGEAYRYGGEEITVLLPNFSRSEGLAAARRMVLLVESSPLSIRADDPCLPAGGEAATEGFVQLEVKISAGVCSTEDVTGAELIVMADKALYEAKESGRNRAVEFSPILNSESRIKTVSVRYQGKNPIFDKSRLILKAWFPLDDAQQIEARYIVFQDGVREMVPEASPRGGLIQLEVPGKVSSVEKQGRFTFFEFDVREEVFELMQVQVASRRESGGAR